MDTLRGTFDTSDPVDDSDGWDSGDEQVARDLPPDSIGQDERRMQVRAYNHWASLLGDRSFPSIEDLEPDNLPDFGPHSVVLDFSVGVEDPNVQYLGDRLGEECGAEGIIERLSDVPPRSLLSRITDHYMQILANQAPIGFEAEFVNQRGNAILYRGILLPFSSNDETIDFIYGVINWKEMADQATADELLLEIDQALEGQAPAKPEEPQAQKHHSDPVTNWADSPAAEETEPEEPSVPSLDTMREQEPSSQGLPMPNFGDFSLDDPDEEDDQEGGAGYDFASLTDYIEAPAKKALDLDEAGFVASDDDSAGYETEPYEAEPYEPEQYIPEQYGPAAYEPLPEEAVLAVEDEADEGDEGDLATPLGEDAGLHDYLAAARELAHTARASEDRSRQALYSAVGVAYDFSLAAQDAPDDYDELIEESGLSVQERAPMTPVVKLVFGADYDKTRLTEYAAVLSHAHRIGLERGALGEFLRTTEGGLKGVVQAERRLRREESGKNIEPADSPRAALARKLRALEAMTLDALSAEGPEFSLVMVRRSEAKGVELIGEIGDDIPLIERAARRMVD